MPKLAFDRVSFPLLGGIETKVADVAVQPPKLRAAENCFAERTGEIRRKRGSTTLPSTTVDNGSIPSYSGAAAAAVALHQGSLLAFDNPQIATGVFEWTEAIQRWTEHGSYGPGVVESETVNAASSVSSIWGADVGVTGNYTLYAFQEDGVDDSGNTRSVVRVSLQDSLTGAFICERMQIFTSGPSAVSSIGQYAAVKVVALLTRFYVFIRDFDNTNLYVWLLDTTSAATITSAIGTSGAGAATAAVLVTNDIMGPAVTGFEANIYDVVPSLGNGIFLAYWTTAGNVIKIGHVSTAGALTHTTTFAAGGPAVDLCVDYHTSSGNHGIAFVESTTFKLSARHYTWSGAAWTLVASSAAVDAGPVTTGCCRYDSGTVLRIWFRDAVVAANPKICQATFSTAGVVSGRANHPQLFNATLQSAPFVADDGKLYYWAFIGPTVAPTYLSQRDHFLVESATGLYVAKANYGVATGTIGAPSGGGGAGHHVVSPSSGRYLTVLSYFTRPSTYAAVYNGNVGVRAVTWVLNHEDSLKMVEAAGSLYMGGAVPQQFDGNSFVELGFSRYVDLAECTFTPQAGGNLAAGATIAADYYIRIIPERYNAQGNREQGTDNGPKKVHLAIGEGKILITIPTMQMTRTRRTNVVGNTHQTPRNDIVFGVYASQANPASSKATLTRVAEIANNPAVGSVQVTHNLADATSINEQSLYISNGIVDHSPTPNGHIICEGMGRLFIAGDPERPNVVFYSLTREPDEAVHFNDAFRVVLPEAGGNIVALAIMNETLVVLKERAIFRVRGSGLSNSGTSGGFFDPELVTPDVGCEGQRTVVVTQHGVWFKAPRGFFLLTGGFELDYVGAPLEGLESSDNPNADTISGAVHLPMEQQVRFSGGRTWVFDYWHKQWFMWSSGVGGSGPSVEYAGNWAYCGVAGIQIESDAGTFTGTMRLVLSLLRGKTLEDEFHVRYFGLAGKNEGSGDGEVHVSLFPNRTSAPPLPVAPQDETAAAIPFGPFFEQWRTVVAAGTHIVSELQLIVDDAGCGATGGLIKLNEVIFELAPRHEGLSARVGR